MAEQAVWALANIAGDIDEYRKMILEQDGFSQIIAVMERNPDKLSVLKNCIWCLSNLCRNQNRIPGLFDYIQPHLLFLQNLFKWDNVNVLPDICWAFAFLTNSNPEQKKTVIEYIDANKLMMLIRCNKPSIQYPALRIAGNIVSGDENDTQRMLDAGLLNVIAEIYPRASESWKKEILWIISNVTAGTPKQINMVMKMGFINLAMNEINGNSSYLQNDAFFVICNAINGGNVEQVNLKECIDS